MLFQQDVATCHTTRANMALLQETFQRSCDLTPFDFPLGGNPKDRVYAGKSSTLEHLKSNICQVKKKSKITSKGSMLATLRSK